MVSKVRELEFWPITNQHNKSKFSLNAYRIRKGKQRPKVIFGWIFSVLYSQLLLARSICKRIAFHLLPGFLSQKKMQNFPKQTLWKTDLLDLDGLKKKTRRAPTPCAITRCCRGTSHNASMIARTSTHNLDLRPFDMDGKSSKKKPLGNGRTCPTKRDMWSFPGGYSPKCWC